MDDFSAKVCAFFILIAFWGLLKIMKYEGLFLLIITLWTCTCFTNLFPIKICIKIHIWHHRGRIFSLFI